MSKKPLHIAVLNHKPARDLPSTASVAHYLHSTHGHTVTLLDSFGVSGNGWEWARRVQPDVIVFPKIIDPPRFLQKTQASSYVDEYDPYCVVLPTERGGFSKKPTPIQNVDLFLAWNAQHATWAKEHHNIDHDLIEITGNPRYDLFASENRLSTNEIKKTRVKYGIPSDWDGPIITVASSFPAADGYLYNQSASQRRIDQSKKFGWRSEQEVIRTEEIKHKAREEFIELIRTINEEYSDIWVSLKIHPTESERRYHETLDGLDQISIVSEDYSARYLQTSDLHIHHDCTTGIEAFMLNVTPIDFLPYNHDELTDSDKGKGSLKAESIPEVLQRIEQLINGTIEIPKEEQEEGQNYVESQFTAVDGMRAEETAKVIDKYLSAASITRKTPRNDFRREIYKKTAVDLFREPDESILQYGAKISRSLISAVRDRPTKTDRHGRELPELLSNELNDRDIQEIERLLDL